MWVGYTVVGCPLGLLLFGAIGKGICAVYPGDSEEELKSELRDEYPTVEIRRDDSGFGSWIEALLRRLDGTWLHADLPLDVRATFLQQRVCEELVAIARGETRTYGEIARALGRPAAARADARARVTNPVSLVIPCHRVVRRHGAWAATGGAS